MGSIPTSVGKPAFRHQSDPTFPLLDRRPRMLQWYFHDGKLREVLRWFFGQQDKGTTSSWRRPLCLRRTAQRQKACVALRGFFRSRYQSCFAPPLVERRFDHIATARRPASGASSHDRERKPKLRRQHSRHRQRPVRLTLRNLKRLAPGSKARVVNGTHRSRNSRHLMKLGTPV